RNNITTNDESRHPELGLPPQQAPYKSKGLCFLWALDQATAEERPQRLPEFVRPGVRQKAQLRHKRRPVFLCKSGERPECGIELAAEHVDYLAILVGIAG